MPLHIQLTPKSTSNNCEVKFDLTKEQLEQRFLLPYMEGRPIVIGGRTIPPDDIQRLQIIYTEHSSDHFNELTDTFASRGDRDWYVGENGKDVTDDFINGPPGGGITTRARLIGPSP